jgi:hypothetical protein
MRQLIILSLLAYLALPAVAVDDTGLQNVTVRQLEQLIDTVHTEPDADVARRLSGLELTERLTSDHYAHLQAVVTGVKARQALAALADYSEFLALPATETFAGDPPDGAAQGSLLALANNYLEKTIPMLPNFFATRDTIYFGDWPAKQSVDTSSVVQPCPLRVMDTSTDTVLFRDGKEVVDAGQTSKRRSARKGQMMTTRGVFGPTLELISEDVLPSNPVFSRWESREGKRLAVFDYSVLADKAHYGVTIPEDPRELCPLAGYHGEIYIDAATGAILRLTLVADFDQDSPVAKSDVLVEYGSVDIGGKSYICPVRSAALLLARPFNLLYDLYGSSHEHLGSFQLELNDVTFREYHLFRSETRILTDDGQR